MFGFGQALNLPVSNVIVVTGYDVTYTVPQGKVWQLMSSSLYNQANDSFENTTHGQSFPKIDSCITFRMSGDNNYISFPDIYGYSVFPSGTELLVNDGFCAA